MIGVKVAHLINDLIQSVLPSIYPMLKANYGLTFTQVGLITLGQQLDVIIEIDLLCAPRRQAQCQQHQ